MDTSIKPPLNFHNISFLHVISAFSVCPMYCILSPVRNYLAHLTLYFKKILAFYQNVMHEITYRRAYVPNPTNDATKKIVTTNAFDAAETESL